MIYSPDIGKVYDTIYYGIIYFNKSAVIKKFTECKYNLDEAFSFYEEVKNSCKPLPQCLYPFFYYDAVTPSAISEYWRSNLDFQVGKMVDFLDLIQNRAKFKKHVFDHLLSSLSDNDREKLMNKNSSIVYKTVERSTWPSLMKEQTILLIYNFSYAADMLYDYLREIYKLIEELHEKYSYIIEQRIKETAEKSTLKMFEKIYSLTEKKAAKQFFSLCFMNQLIRYTIRQGNDEFLFLLGNKFKEEFITVCNDQSVSIDTIFITFGDKIRLDTIRLFHKHGNLTLSELSRLANVSTSTAFNAINILNEGKIIRESHKDGQKVYYSLNREILFLTRDTIVAFINDILKTDSVLKENKDE